MALSHFTSMDDMTALEEEQAIQRAEARRLARLDYWRYHE